MKISTGMLLFAAILFPLWSHPMGNFSVNRFSGITLGATRVDVVYTLDLAEIPTLDLIRQWGSDAEAPRSKLKQKASEQMNQWAANLRLMQGNKQLPFKVSSTELVMADGAGNLPVIRITANLEAAAKPGRIDFEDLNYPSCVGWREITISSSDGFSIAKASHSAVSVSRGLTAYPSATVKSPPRDLRAFAEWRPSGSVLTQPVIIAIPQPDITASAAPQQTPSQSEVTRGDYLSTLLGRRDLSFGMMLVGLAAAFGFGAMHALSPGHGKTIVAAYLVGSRGTVKHALFLGAMVTFTHTISVFLLGFGTLLLSAYIVPEKIIPVLSILSGLSIAMIGGYLLIQRTNHLMQQVNHTHDGHDHSHGGINHHHGHHHGPGGHTHVPEGEVSMASLIGLAISGGMVPCPSALILLLSAISIGRTGFGLALLTSFSFGLAFVLMAIGLIVLFAKNLLPESSQVRNRKFFLYVPVISAFVIFCVGMVMTGIAAGLIKPFAGLG